MSFAEVKADAIYFLVRELAERSIRPFPLVEREATRVTAKQLSQEKGNFQEAANDYYSVSRRSNDTGEKAESLVDLSQELINLGRFRQARIFLTQAQQIIPSLMGDQRRIEEARVNEKFGWIADYEGGYKDAVKYFQKAQTILNESPRERWSNQEKDINSTATHFTGRAYFGLAAQGIHKEENIRNALTYFNEDLGRFLDLRDKGHETSMNEGFAYGWIARCYFILGDLAEAEKMIEKVDEQFSEFVENHPGRGVMSHYYLLRGRLRLKRNLLTDAEDDFREALRIRTEVEQYPKGFADASLGLALTSWKQRRPVKALSFSIQAFKAYPLAILGAVAGG